MPGGKPKLTKTSPNCIFDKGVGSTCVIRTLRVLEEGEEAIVDYGNRTPEKMFLSGLDPVPAPDATSVGSSVTAASVIESSRSKRPMLSRGEAALSEPIKRNRSMEKLSAARSELRRLL